MLGDGFHVHRRQNENFLECERTAGFGSDAKTWLTAPICAALGNRFQTWRGIARFQAGIVWEDSAQQFFGIFQTHKAALCGNERHISSQPAEGG
jgi:hypothetical protein